jgi:hypothetical protein
MIGFYEIRFSKMMAGGWILRDGAQGLMIHECCIGIWKTKDLLYYYSLQGGGLGVELFQRIPLNSFLKIMDFSL